MIHPKAVRHQVPEPPRSYRGTYINEHVAAPKGRIEHVQNMFKIMFVNNA